MVDLLQNTLAARGLKSLTPWFKKPDISSAFDDVVTYRIPDVSELYGIFLAGWDYMQAQLNKASAPWTDENSDAYVIEKTINDLVEKSIRNFEIRERWSNVAAN